MARRWTEKEERLLGTASDQVVARKIKRTVAAVRQRRMIRGIRLRPPWRPEDDKIVGTRPDEQVAMLLKRRTDNVAIGPSAGAETFASKGPGYRNWDPQNDHLLGMLRDE